ncbi:MAG TPA: hypothetical protein VFW19_00330 [Allosphingosinicella sp.]|nr:hypothetical protein [Allosphingosinicella sp.]
MGNPVSKAAFAAWITAAFLVAQPAEAAMGCWNEQQAAAAKVRDLQSRLMVAALRCRAMGYDVLGAYNDFIRRNRTALQTSNGLIHAQFETGYGKDAETYYDRFETGLANRYGGDATTAEICQDFASAAEEGAAAGGDLGKLLALEDRFGPAPKLPGGACPASAPAPRATQPSAPAKSFGAAMNDALAAASDGPDEQDAPPPRADEMPANGDGPQR